MYYVNVNEDEKEKEKRREEKVINNKKGDVCGIVNFFYVCYWIKKKKVEFNL